MAATVSLSKGVFAFKKSKTRKNDRKDSFTGLEYWRQEEGRNDAHIQECTLKNYKKYWSLSNSITKKLLHETHVKVLEDLVLFVKNAGSLKCLDVFSQSRSENKDIPAACLVTGVNMPDHCTIFDSLTKSLKESVSPHVSRLLPADCSSIKLAVFKLIHSLMNQDEEDLVFESDSEDEIFIKFSKQKGLKRKQYNMAVLSSWYKETETAWSESSRKLTTKGGFSPTKKLKTTHKHAKDSTLNEAQGRPVIIIVEEVESVVARVLQDLILIISEHQQNLPFLFIFGVSTSSSYIHRHLSQEASSFVAMEVFQAQPSTAFLSEVVERLLMDSCLPFRLGGKVFKLLLDIFLFHDLSIKNFISGFKLCMLEHFLRGNVSFLCCAMEEREVLLCSLTPVEASALRRLPSYKKLQESLPAEDQDKMKKDDYLAKRVSLYLTDLESWYITFCSLVRVLHCLVYTLPSSPLGKQVREVFSACLGQQVTEQEEFQSAWKLLSMSGKEELMPKIENSITVLQEYRSTPETEDLLESLIRYSERLTSIGFEVEKDEEGTKRSPVVVDLKPSDRFYLKEKLLGIQKLKAPRKPFEELRKDILTCFENAFILHLKPVYTKPFHEVFFFDSIANVKYQLLGSLRATITTGLANPHKYLQCDCCRLDEPNDLVTSLPDLSICYKLHLECGRFINLYDWMQAFVAVVGGDDDDSSARHKKKNSVDETLQARFVQSVSELQLLGFIKSSKKKTDHVQRLTWGGC